MIPSLLGLHLFALFKCLNSRLVGLNYLLRVDCTRPGEVIFPLDKPLFVYFAPIATVLVYLAVAVEIITNNDTDLHGSKWVGDGFPLFSYLFILDFIEKFKSLESTKSAISTTAST